MTSKSPQCFPESVSAELIPGTKMVFLSLRGKLEKVIQDDKPISKFHITWFNFKLIFKIRNESNYKMALKELLQVFF